MDSKYFPKNKTLHEATISGYINDIKLLTYFGHNPNANTQIQVMVGDDKNQAKVRSLTPLAISILRGNLEIMDFFINLPNCGVNVTDDYGKTAIHYACETDF